MDKNSIVGLILIAMVLFGFTYVQRRKYEQQMAQSQEMVDDTRQGGDPGLTQVAPQTDIAQAGQDVQQNAQQVTIYKDTSLTMAAMGQEQFYTLENNLLKLTFTTKGAQLYSARIKDYTNYDKTDLYLFKDGGNKYDVSVYAGEAIKTSDFNFTLAESSNTKLVFRLFFDGGGYIEQRYELPQDSYMMDNTLSFVGLGSVIPQNVSNIDIDFATVVPRMEKGFKNESQYSKLDYYFNGEKKP